MFREMRRIKQALSQDECTEVLKNEPRGVLILNRREWISIRDSDGPLVL